MNENIRGKIKVRPSQDDIEMAQQLKALSKQVDRGYERLGRIRDELGVKPGESLVEALLR